MKTRLLLFTLVCISTLAHGTKIQYVTQKGAGLKNGSSWENAKEASKLQSAIDEAALTLNGQVWVAGGTYKPTVTDQRDVHFSLKTGVVVFGGFEGTETSINERQREDLDQNGVIESWEFKHPSILSGNIGDTNTENDNSYNLIVCERLDTNSFFDGFTITQCLNTNFWFRNEPNELAPVNNCYLKNSVITANRSSAAGGFDNCFLKFCKIADNYSEIGAGGGANSTLRNCLVENNRTSGWPAGVANSKLTYCKIKGNYGSYANGGGVSHSTLNYCILDDNFAGFNGGGAYKSDLMHCRLLRNGAERGGSVSDSYLKRCFIEQSSSASEWAIGTYSQFDECFVKGSEYSNDFASCSFESCILSNSFSSLSSNIKNSILTLNERIYLDGSTVANCLVANNGDISSIWTRITNSTVVNNNYIDWYGSGYSDDMYNSIFWGNKKLEVNSEVIEYCAFEDSVYAGTGNISLDSDNRKGPRFVRPSDSVGVPTSNIGILQTILANWRLRRKSPCIDAGDNEYVAQSTDLDGNKRISNGTVDMGCYESSGWYWRRFSKIQDISVQIDEARMFVAPEEYKNSNTFKNAETDEENPSVINPVSAQFIVYPNVVDHDEVSVSPDNNEKYSVKIYNLNGGLKYQENNLEGVKTIHLSNLPASVYQVVIISNNGNVEKTRIVKQ